MLKISVIVGHILSEPRQNYARNMQHILVPKRCISYIAWDLLKMKYYKRYSLNLCKGVYYTAAFVTLSAEDDKCKLAI